MLLSLVRLFPSGRQAATFHRCLNSTSCVSHRPSVTMATKGEIIAVTGGAGFLGQHIVKLLQLKRRDLREIRVFDKIPYENKLGHSEEVPLWSIVGDLCNPDDVLSAFKGVNSVIHVAGMVSFGTFPDIDGMEKVNVHGTQNVIDSCLKQNVARLVFCSTVDVVIGYDEIHNGDEETTSKPDEFLFPGYPDTKYRAERLVLEANEKPTANGKKLRTVSLRPNVMYGELDPYYVVNPLRAAKSSGGTLYKVGAGKALFQQSYVGNVAWAFLQAEAGLRQNPVPIAGQSFFVPDDTPVQSVFDFLAPFLTVRSYSLSKYPIPYWFLYSLMYILETVLWIISPVYKLNFQTPLCSIIYTNMTLYFNRNKAESLFNYKPIYTPEDSMKNSLEFYKNVQL